MNLPDHLKNIKERLQKGSFTSEASVSQGILLPALQYLEWPIFDTTIVVPEFSIEGRRVDFALCNPKNKPAVFIEVKKVGLSDGADRQLFEYAFHFGVPMAILTDGREWSFYLPGEQGRYDERRVYKIDILERSIEETVKRLNRYLHYENVKSGEALKAARSDYQDVARYRIIENTLPKAWNILLKEQDSILLELLAEKVEDLCGYKPDFDLCGHFIKTQTQSTQSPEKQTVAQHSISQKSKKKNLFSGYRKRTNDFTFIFKGKEYSANSAKEVMCELFKLLANEDKGFLERFSSIKHGRKRRYLDQDKYKLYPDRDDLAERHSSEIAPGWWIGTNYSHKNIQDIIDLALTVTEPQLRSQIKVKIV